MKFSELDLKPEVLQSLDEMGYVDMTPIQEQAIPHILAGRDLVGLAETGSGKTSESASGPDSEVLVKYVWILMVYCKFAQAIATGKPSRQVRLCCS